MAFLRKLMRQREEKPRPVAPPKNKEKKCKVKFKTGKDGSETFESTGCTESQTQMAVKMREERRRDRSEDE